MQNALLRMYAMVILVFLLDQVSKYFVLYGLDLINTLYHPVWPPFLQFTMAWNQGVNFGLMASGSDMGRWVFIALALAICGALTVWGRNKPGWLTPLAIGAVIGGALGNVYDRIIFGAVADFLNMSCCGIRNPFAFNIADVAIFAGAVLLVLFSPSAEQKA